MPEWKDIINYILTGVNILVTGYFSYLVLKTAKINNNLVKSFSSEKAFLTLECYTNSRRVMKLPIIQIKNAGPGHAINVEVFTQLCKVDISTGKISYPIVQLQGADMIPYIQNGDNDLEDYEYIGDENLSMPAQERRIVLIKYKNASGYQETIVWKMKGDRFVIVPMVDIKCE